MPPRRNEEQNALITKVGDEETGPVRRGDRNGNGGFYWLVIAALIITAGVVLGAIALAGGFSSSSDDDDDGGSSDNMKRRYSPLELQWLPSHITNPQTCFESIREGNNVACHDPTGCSGPEDKSDWCYVSDDLQPVMFAKIYADLIKLLDRNSELAQIGLKLANLSSTCVVGACKERQCLCHDNGNGTSFCEAVTQDVFPFVTITANNYPNCEPPEVDSDEVEEGPTFFEGNPTNCACLDPTGCANPDNPTDRCFASMKHDGAEDSCFPGACSEGGMYLCQCVDHGNGTSSCPTTLPFRDVQVVSNCETFLPGGGDNEGSDSAEDSDAPDVEQSSISDDVVGSVKKDIDVDISTPDSGGGKQKGPRVEPKVEPTESVHELHDSDELHHCTFDHIVEGNSIACHDPVGCSGPEDKTEWCYVSDEEQPVMWAVVNQDLIELQSRNSTIGKIGLQMANLSATCVVGACFGRPCLCTDNENGTSFCEAFHEEQIPFRNVKEGNYPNCLPDDEEKKTLEDDGPKFFQGTSPQQEWPLAGMERKTIKN
eukprot:282073-Prorocentrum_minimum.AAC.1